jgi:hypothetical protein
VSLELETHLTEVVVGAIKTLIAPTRDWNALLRTFFTTGSGMDWFHGTYTNGGLSFIYEYRERHRME